VSQFSVILCGPIFLVLALLAIVWAVIVSRRSPAHRQRASRIAYILAVAISLLMAVLLGPSIVTSGYQQSDMWQLVGIVVLGPLVLLTWGLFIAGALLRRGPSRGFYAGLAACVLSVSVFLGYLTYGNI